MWPTVSELFAETFHATLSSLLWGRHIAVQFWCTNMAAGNKKKTSGVCDKHPLELGGLQQKCLPWEFWIFFGTIQGGLSWHLQRFL